MNSYFLSKQFLLSIVLATIGSAGYTQASITSPNSFFRSNQSGNWSIASNWDWSADGINYTSPSTMAPDHNAKGIIILHGHTIDVDTGISLDKTIIEGELQVKNGGKLNIENTSGVSVQINDCGKLLMNTTDNYNDVIAHPLFGNDGILFRIKSGGKIQVGTGEYTTGTGYEALATFGKNEWETGSGLIWNNGMAFGTSGYTYFPSATNEVPVFSIGPTPVPNISTAGILLINGIFDIRTDVNFSAATGERIFKDGITGNSTLTIADGNSGTQNITGHDAVLGGSNLTLNLGKNLNLIKSVQIPKDSSVIVKGHSITNNNGCILTINGTLDMTNQNMTNPGSIMINGKYRTEHSGGFTGTGSSIPSDNVTLNPGSTIEFYADGDQVFKSRNDFSNLIFSGSGEKKPSSGFTYDGIIIIQDSAIFNAASHTIGDSSISHLAINGGRYITTSTGTNPTIKGNYSIIGGTVQFGSTNQTPQTIRSRTYYDIEITGSNVSNSSGKIEIRPNGSFIIKNGGRYTSSSGNAPITAANGTSENQTLKVETGGIFRTAVTEGFYGDNPGNISDQSPSVQNSIPHVILEPGSLIEYAREKNKLPGTASDGNQKITFDESTYTYQDLTLSGDGAKTAPPDYLKIKGDFRKTGYAVFDHNKGTVTFNGGSAENGLNEQKILANNIIFFNLINQNQIKLQVDSNVAVKQTFTMNNGSKLHLETGDLTIISDEDGTGNIAMIPGDAQITYNGQNGGRFKIERYIPDHPKAWQLLSVNTSGGTIRESWQNNQDNTAGRGVNITGPQWTLTDTKGFDGYSPAPSVKWHNPETNLFTGVTSTNNLIDDYPAYFLFVRGDRSVYLPTEPATSVTLHTRGKLYAPDNQPPSVTIKPEKWVLAGNPYASAIDFEKLEFDGGQPESSYHIWDPHLTQLTVDGGHSEYGLGAYRAVTKIGDHYEATPPVDPDDPTAPYPSIQSGQGFYVRNSSDEDDSTITFNESAKIDQESNVFRTQNTTSIPVSKIRTNLLVNINGSAILLDGALQLFDDGYNAGIDRFDSRKIEGGSENLSLLSDKYPLIIERRPFAAEGDTLFYNLRGMAEKDYTLQVTLDEMQRSNHEVYLNDSYKDMARLLQDGVNEISFNINDEPASSQKHRFYLTFKKILPPFRFLDEKAKAEPDKINISWKAEHQEPVISYTLEHAPNKQSFRTLQRINTTGTENESYLLTHHEPDDGVHHYRIKAIMKDNSHIYSQPIAAEIRYKQPSLTVYPNPAKDFVHLEFYRQTGGKYTVRLLNGDGRQVISQIINHAGFRNIYKISVPKAAGFYRLEITMPDGSKSFEKVIVL